MPSPVAFASYCPASSSLVPSLVRSDLRGHLNDIKALVLSTVKSLPNSPIPSPIQSLRQGNWVKLICGASFEDAADVRNLSLVYTLAGVDCIDCAADAAVVGAVNEGIDAAMSIAMVKRPWVMISVNDDKEDVHFRKAEFDPEDCPSDCPRPCEKVCPASAIVIQRVVEGGGSVENNRLDKLQFVIQGGVITERCYGCGRCFSSCPYDRISATTYARDPTTTSKLLQRSDVDAIEIHTSGRRTDLFNLLWDSLVDSVENAKLVAVSLPNVGESTLQVMNMIYETMQPHLKCYNLWQLDGRPMSGDIGKGATREAIAFAIQLAATCNKPHGFYQLAGGTNAFTIESLKKYGLFQTNHIDYVIGNSSEARIEDEQIDPRQAYIGGIAYGGYARKVLCSPFRSSATTSISTSKSIFVSILHMFYFLKLSFLFSVFLVVTNTYFYFKHLSDRIFMFICNWHVYLYSNIFRNNERHFPTDL
ncbi:uncharacterized protein LOC121969327 isoform X2 [Zingiber officinale]|uniref:uncharacterized protein LOC121969327 isoform X2 n=1 Tax=Zingiber officinale TaxID=94328 RepID=UPI001C4AB070|nr:uncharacterized protein LOC121969327 isoform X2 [Zingiber officinale]